jgi:hypothetical protein
MDIKKGTPLSLATFSIASLGESNWWVTFWQLGHRYPSIMLTSPMMGISLWRRKSIVRVIPRAEISEGWVTIRTPSSPDMLSKNENTSLAAHGNKHVKYVAFPKATHLQFRSERAVVPTAPGSSVDFRSTER